MAKTYTPISEATRAARQALRGVPRESVVSVGSRYAYDLATARTDVVTTVIVRSDDALSGVVRALGPSAAVTGARHVELRRAA